MLQSRLDIPYVTNSGNACALACYTMAAQYFFPNTTFEEIAKISDWHPGYAVWGFKFRLWMMNQGIAITHIEAMDYARWAEDGIAGLEAITDPEEFAFYNENTYDLATTHADIHAMLDHPLYTFKNHAPTWSDITTAHTADELCTVTLNCAALDETDEYDLHVVIILDITPSEIIFHDPRSHDQANWGNKRAVSHVRFKSAFVGVPGAELVTFKTI